MSSLKVFVIVSWISLPTVMFGGYSLLRLLTQPEKLTPSQLGWFRAGHAHAGVLLVMSLVYYAYLGRAELSNTVKLAACIILIAGILAQSGGFFIHMAVGKPHQASMGTVVTICGALLLATAIAILIVGLIRGPAI